MRSARAGLDDARLYFVCDARRPDGELAALLERRSSGGVDLIQLRDKEAGDERLLAAAAVFREAADRHGVPFLINDRPDLVARVGADGVHVGQDDTPVAEARALAGPDAIVGLSTHSPEQLAAAHEATRGRDGPTTSASARSGRRRRRPGARPPGSTTSATRPPRRRSPGSRSAGSTAATSARCARPARARIVVVRAIADAEEPEAAARALRAGDRRSREAAAAVSSRERKRAERRKRKMRSAEPSTAPTPTTAATNGARRPTVEDLAAEAEARGISRSELKNERVRAELEPLEEGERPIVVTVGAVVSGLIAASILIAWIAGAEVDVGNAGGSERPNAFQVFPPAILFGVMAWGMWRSRYWAVLGFEAIMAIIMVGSFITLVAATSVFKAISAAAVLIAAGALFWFTVKALARIQMPTPRRERATAPLYRVALHG